MNNSGLDTMQMEQKDTTEKPKPIEKVSIIISKGSLEAVYPGLIMANGARMEGIEATLFFTFFGLESIIAVFKSLVQQRGVLRFVE